jgi:hypothetical protein
MIPSIFEDKVRREFALLLEAFAFRCGFSGGHLVRFESERAFVNVRYDEISFEIGVEMALLSHCESKDGPPFSLAEALRFKSVPIAEEFGFLQASTAERMVVLVERAAAAVRRYLGPLLLGSKEEFALLMKFRRNESATYAMSERLKDARATASAAWAAKNYSSYISILAPFRPALSRSEIEKLAYAERKRSHRR